MSHSKWLASFGLLALVTAPVASYAGADRAVHACVKSFVDTYLPGRTVRVRKEIEAPSLHRRREDTYTIALAAHGAKSGKLFAQARCVASARGDVVVLDNLPLDSHVASADFTVALK